MAHDEIERETVPLPDAETTPAPAQGHLIGEADLDGGLGAEDDGALGEGDGVGETGQNGTTGTTGSTGETGDGAVGAAIPSPNPAESSSEPDPEPAQAPDPAPASAPAPAPEPTPAPDSIAVTSSRTPDSEPPPDLDLDAPDDRPRRPADPRARTVPLPSAKATAPSNRSKGLIAAAVAGVLVVGGAVAATAGGGSGRSADKSAAPTAGLPGRQGSDNGAAVPTGGTDGSPWAWQTGQAAPTSPGATSSVPATSGGPTSTGTSSGPGTPAPTGPGAAPHSSSAPGQPSGPAPSTPPSTVGGVVPPPTVTPATVTLVVGPGCPGLAGGGGYYTVGNGSDSGWGGNGSGGWGGDGCNGSMQSMPMTGDSSNGPNRALWYFGSGTAGFASCSVSVYVPWDGKATDTGGAAAEYQIVEGSTETYVTSFTVDQNTTHGQWVPLGTVAIGGQTVKVRLVDHGVDYPAGWRYGIAAAKLKCTS